MNETLSESAKTALKAPQFVRLPHRCQQWVREVVQHVYGNRFDRYFYRVNAIGSGLAFKNSPYCVPLENGSVPGDILYKLSGSGGDGHVGIRILGNKVAENSSVHWDGQDARGIRTLREFGNFDLIVRLPEK
jgi:hypothetical protein